ncbi:MAG: hypothetical protein OEU68_07310 [Nitrospira sp.]|nr:hypothetical protein [Nitrospira sp.]MDH4245037.1 hypothetical protein [Nitrospira sp.]MDH4355958.1 hypothetical protein [Nitrospira sp.]MDH5319368.1 hypothetical protein [Nitrospira sp.]
MGLLQWARVVPEAAGFESEAVCTSRPFLRRSVRAWPIVPAIATATTHRSLRVSADIQSNTRVISTSRPGPWAVLPDTRKHDAVVAVFGIAQDNPDCLIFDIVGGDVYDD